MIVFIDISDSQDDAVDMKVFSFAWVCKSNLNCKFLFVGQDFEGQGRAETLSRIIITLFGAVGFIWGLIIQQFSQTVFILAAGVILSLIVSIARDIFAWLP